MFMKLNNTMSDDELLPNVRAILSGRDAHVMFVAELDRLASEVETDG